MRSADAGSTRASIRCRNGDAAALGDRLEPRAQRARRGRARETARASARDSRSPVPPTRIGRRPRAVDVANRRARHRARTAPPCRSSVGSTMSIRWCGMPRRSRQRHLVGADVEAAIHGGRVAVDDLAAEPLRQRERRARSCRWPSGRGPQRPDGVQTLSAIRDTKQAKQDHAGSDAARSAADRVTAALRCRRTSR